MSDQRERTAHPAPQALSPGRRVPLITVLCAIAGSIDAISYLLCGQVFVANMTGNTVLFAISLLGHDAHRGLLRGGLVLAFFCGVVLARLIARRTGRRTTPGQRIILLCFQATILALLAWRAAHAELHLLLAVLAALLGLQNGAFRYIGGFNINTTFITGNLEQLGEAVTDPHSSPGAAASFLASWLGYLGGGLLGALAAFAFPPTAFLIPAALTLAAALLIGIMPRSAA